MTFRKSVMGALSLAVAAFVMLLGLSAPASAAPGCAPAYPPGNTTIELSRNVVPQGQAVSFAASCFAQAETVLGEVRSEPIQVGTWTADAQGQVEGEFTVPEGLHPGRHTFILTGQQSGTVEKVRFTVVPAVAAGAPGLEQTGGPSSLAFTGVEVAGMVGGGLALIGGGVLLVMVARRRRTPLGA